MDRGAWQPIVHGVAESDMTQQPNNKNHLCRYGKISKKSPMKTRIKINTNAHTCMYMCFYECIF